MGSNPILAAIYQRELRTRRSTASWEGGQLLPDFYRAGSLLAPNDLIEVGAGTGEPLGQRVNVDLEGKRAAVPVAELGGDIGGGYASGS
jgi:hypothetical protein